MQFVGEGTGQREGAWGWSRCQIETQEGQADAPAAPVLPMTSWVLTDTHEAANLRKALCELTCSASPVEASRGRVHTSQGFPRPSQEGPSPSPSTGGSGDLGSASILWINVASQWLSPRGACTGQPPRATPSGTSSLLRHGDVL